MFDTNFINILESILFFKIFKVIIITIWDSLFKYNFHLLKLVIMIYDIDNYI